MASTTPNIGLTLPTGAEKVSRQIINDNNTKIDTAIGTLNDKLSSESSWIEIIQGSTACYATIHNGIIFVRGHSFGGITIGGGSGYVALATLPERYRPLQTLYFPVGWSGSGLNMQIGSDGVISFAGDAKTYWNYFVSYPF